MNNVVRDWRENNKIAITDFAAVLPGGHTKQKTFFPNQDIFSQDIPISNSIKQKLFFKNGNFLFWLLADTTTLEEHTKKSHNFIEQEGGKKVFLSGQVDWKKWTFDQAFLNN